MRCPKRGWKSNTQNLIFVSQQLRPRTSADNGLFPSADKVSPLLLNYIRPPWTSHHLGPGADIRGHPRTSPRACEEFLRPKSALCNIWCFWSKSGKFGKARNPAKNRCAAAAISWTTRAMSRRRKKTFKMSYNPKNIKQTEKAKYPNFSPCALYSLTYKSISNI